MLLAYVLAAKNNNDPLKLDANSLTLTAVGEEVKLFSSPSLPIDRQYSRVYLYSSQQVTLYAFNIINFIRMLSEGFQYLGEKVKEKSEFGYRIFSMLSKIHSINANHIENIVKEMCANNNGDNAYVESDIYEFAMQIKNKNHLFETDKLENKSFELEEGQYFKNNDRYRLLTRDILFNTVHSEMFYSNIDGNFDIEKLFDSVFSVEFDIHNIDPNILSYVASFELYYLSTLVQKDIDQKQFEFIEKLSIIEILQELKNVVKFIMEYANRFIFEYDPKQLYSLELVRNALYNVTKQSLFHPMFFQTILDIVSFDENGGDKNYKQYEQLFEYFNELREFTLEDLYFEYDKVETTFIKLLNYINNNSTTNNEQAIKINTISYFRLFYDEYNFVTSLKRASKKMEIDFATSNIVYESNYSVYKDDEDNRRLYNNFRKISNDYVWHNDYDIDKHNIFKNINMFDKSIYRNLHPISLAENKIEEIKDPYYNYDIDLEYEDQLKYFHTKIATLEKIIDKLHEKFLQELGDDDNDENDEFTLYQSLPLTFNYLATHEMIHHKYTSIYEIFDKYDNKLNINLIPLQINICSILSMIQTHRILNYVLLLKKIREIKNQTNTMASSSSLSLQYVDSILSDYVAEETQEILSKLLYNPRHTIPFETSSSYCLLDKTIRLYAKNSLEYFFYNSHVDYMIKKDDIHNVLSETCSNFDAYHSTLGIENTYNDLYTSVPITNWIISNITMRSIINNAFSDENTLRFVTDLYNVFKIHDVIDIDVSIKGIKTLFVIENVVGTEQVRNILQNYVKNSKFSTDIILELYEKNSRYIEKNRECLKGCTYDKFLHNLYTDIPILMKFIDESRNLTNFIALDAVSTIRRDWKNFEIYLKLFANIKNINVLKTDKIPSIYDDYKYKAVSNYQHLALGSIEFDDKIKTVPEDKQELAKDVYFDLNKKLYNNNCMTILPFITESISEINYTSMPLINSRIHLYKLQITMNKYIEILNDEEYNECNSEFLRFSSNMQYNRYDKFGIIEEENNFLPIKKYCFNETIINSSVENRDKMIYDDWSYYAVMLEEMRKLERKYTEEKYEIEDFMKSIALRK